MQASRKEKEKLQLQLDEEKRLKGTKYHLKRAKKLNGKNKELVDVEESQIPESVATSSSISQDEEDSSTPVIKEKRMAKIDEKNENNQAEILQSLDMLHADNQKIILALVNIGTKLNTMIDILSKKK